MKRLRSYILVAILCLGLFGCGEKAPEYTMEGVLLSHSLEMSELIGEVADNFESMSYSSNMVALAETFTCLEEEPDKAWITDVGSVGTTVNILHGQLLGVEHLACASSMTQSTMVQLPMELDDTYGVLLRFRGDDETAYCLVVYDPVEEGVTSVMAYAVFSDVAKELISGDFDDAETYDDEEIEALCEAAEDVSLTAEPADEKADEDYYLEKALEIMEGVSRSRGDPSLYTQEEEILDYCDRWVDAAGEEPTDVEVWVLEDLDDAMDSLGWRGSSWQEDYLRRAIGAAVPMQFTAPYGDTVVAACSVTQRIAKSVYLGPAPEDQPDLVLVVLSYGDEATAVVCIYDSGYGLNQYNFGFLPGPLDEDLEEEGFERF